MAYTIISQNNTTTTLSDENGNVITVPARVTLATSTDYTITKVNNNSVDLESGDGKTIRGVPACVVLAGGGSSDPHNLGFYADLTALQTAYPTGSDGDFAILGSTDTVWVWDSGTSAWKDTDTKGQVTSVNGQTGAVVIPDELPSQTGNSGKFLTTDGTDASWSDKPLVNKSTDSTSVSILGESNGYANSVAVGQNAMTRGETVAVGYSSQVESRNIAIGYAASAKTSFGGSVAIGHSASADISSAGWKASVAIGPNAKANASGSIQISATKSNSTTVTPTNTDANTFKVSNDNGNFEIMSADGTIPSDRLIHAINKYSTMPTAASTNEGWIVQFTGTTDSTYTHGHLYECVSDGQDPATYSWTEVSLGGGSALPDQTGQSGKFLTTDGTDASWSDKPLVNTATGTNSLTILGTANTTYTNSVNIGVGSSVTWTESVAIGYGAKAKQGTAIGRDAVSTGSGGIKIGIGSMSGGDAVGIGASAVANASFSVAIGRDTRTTAENAVAIGMQAEATAKNAIQIGGGTNSTTRTFAVGLGYWDNVTHTYRLLDSDGTIPAARHAALPAADGTYTLQLVIADGVPTLSWVAV